MSFIKAVHGVDLASLKDDDAPNDFNLWKARCDMKLLIHANGLTVTGAMSRWIEQSVLTALRRYETRIGYVQVWLRDVNGPRRGEDMECELVVHLPRKQVVVIKELQDDLYEAVRTATARLNNAVTRKWNRRRRWRVPRQEAVGRRQQDELSYSKVGRCKDGGDSIAPQLVE